MWPFRIHWPSDSRSICWAILYQVSNFSLPGDDWGVKEQRGSTWTEGRASYLSSACVVSLLTWFSAAVTSVMDQVWILLGFEGNPVPVSTDLPFRCGHCPHLSLIVTVLPKCLNESAAAAAAKSLQSCPTLCNPIDGSPLGFPVPGVLQARTLEWVASSFSNAWKWKVKGKSLSRVRLFATPWTAARQAPPSMGFSKQEYWSGVPSPYNN